MVVEKINIIKTTFDFNFDLYHAFKQHFYTKREKRVVEIRFFLTVCRLVKLK